MEIKANQAEEKPGQAYKRDSVPAVAGLYHLSGFFVAKKL